jgi:hypothetical protein
MTESIGPVASMISAVSLDQACLVLRDFVERLKALHVCKAFYLFKIIRYCFGSFELIAQFCSGNGDRVDANCDAF